MDFICSFQTPHTCCSVRSWLFYNFQRGSESNEISARLFMKRIKIPFVKVFFMKFQWDFIDLKKCSSVKFSEWVGGNCGFYKISNAK